MDDNYMKLHECIHFNIGRAQQTVAQIFREHLGELDITPIQYAVLNILWNHDGLAPKDLAEEIAVDRPVITGILDRLESKELIYRSPDAYDRRAINVFLTEKALEIQEASDKAVADANEYALRNFTKEEEETFRKLLSIVADN